MKRISTPEDPRRRPFILASGSPRRRMLLRRAVSRFRVIESGVPEPPPRAGTEVRRYVVRLARRKAWAVAKEVASGWVLGADTVVFRRGKIYGKPVDREDAHRTLAELGGKWHDVYTGLALVRRPGKRIWSRVDRTRVLMRAFTPLALRRLSAQNRDKAGAYAAQARGNPFVLRFKGDFDNVIGLPLKGLKKMAAEAGAATGETII